MITYKKLNYFYFYHYTEIITMFNKLPVELNEAIFECLPIKNLVNHLDYNFVFGVIKRKYNEEVDRKYIVANLELTKYLIDIIDKDEALVEAAEIGNLDVVKYLINQGANLDILEDEDEESDDYYYPHDYQIAMQYAVYLMVI